MSTTTSTATYAESVDRQIRSGRDSMERLCASFPSLHGVPGTAPWDPPAFAAWASGGIADGERMAAQCVLSIWNWGSPNDTWWNEEPYSVGVFDAITALRTWDYDHCAAYVGWCLKPFWP